MSKYAQGIFKPKHPEKYIGIAEIKYRSSWELHMMMFMDGNANIIQWASESIKIPYMHPFTGKLSNYIPDFLMIYKNSNNAIIAEVIEVKPQSQTSITEAKSKNDKIAAVINMAKWNAAKMYCIQRGMSFRVITEKQIFRNGKS